MIRIILIAIILLESANLSTANTIYDTDKEITVGSLLLKKGLKQDYINCTIQDSEGFIWVGGSRGLYVYDGHSFEPFLVGGIDFKDVSVNLLFKDITGRIWIASPKGLYIYHKESRGIEKLPTNHFLKGTSVIYQQDDSVFWIGTRFHTLIKYNTNSRQLDEFLFPTKNYIKTISSYNSKQIIVGFRDGGQAYFNTDLNKFNEAIPENKLISSSVLAGVELRTKELIVVSDEGIYLSSADRGGYELGNPRQNNLSSVFPNVTCAIEINDSTIWIGTDGSGLLEYNLNTDRLVPIKFQEGLTVRAITSLNLSIEGIVWIGTTNAGVLIYMPEKTIFKHWGYEKGNLTGLSYNSVLCLEELANGDILLGLDGGGVNILNKKNNRFIHYDTEEVGAPNVGCVMQDSKEQIWIGTYSEGLKCYNLANNKLVAKKLPFEFPSGVYVKCLLEDKLNNIWIGTGNYGVYKYNPKFHTVRNFNTSTSGGMLNSNLITALYEDCDSTILIGTISGLNRLNVTSNEIEKVPLGSSKFSHIYITSILKSTDNVLWVGTKKGLFKLDSAETDTICFTQKNGLSSNIVNGLLEDDFANLWITSDQGITAFNTKTGVFRNFGRDDGIIGTLYENVCLKSNDNTLYFGGSDGIYSCKQNEVKVNTYIPPVVITSVNVHMADSIKNSSAVPLNLKNKEEIVLNYKQNVFSIEFVALNYTLHEKNVYEYKLEGYDKNWINVVDAHEVIYTNVPPGSYVFTIKAANNDGLWNNTGRSLNIKVLPPWYKTTLASILWIAILLLLIVLINRYIVLQLRLKYQLKMERADKQKQHEINQNKLQFFTNITHELRSPLTLILGPLGKIIRNTAPNSLQYRDLQMMSKNADRLVRLIDQILEFRKVEHGTKQLSINRYDVVAVVQGLCNSYMELAKEKKINLSFHSRFSKLFLWVDYGMLEIIVLNLLSNAFKFTPESGVIEVEIDVNSEDKKATIVVRDSGKGISEANLLNIFDQFYQVKEDAKYGTGIGLALTKSLVEIQQGFIAVKSELGKGSEFRVDFKFGKAHFSSELAKSNTSSMNADVADQKPTNLDSSILLQNSCNPKLLKEREFTVLVVEDDNDLREFITSELNEAFFLHEAKDGAEGFAMAQQINPDLIISDILMPKVDGLELCKKIKTNFDTSHIPVILLTALGSENNKVMGLEIGADDYISKPFNTLVLILKIKNLLKARKKLLDRFKTEVAMQPEDIVVASGDEVFLKNAIDTIKQHMSDSGYTVDHLITELGMSRSLFFKKIKGLTGLSPSGFIRTIKLKHSTQLLIKSSMTISEIAFEVGYSSAKHFRESFKKLYGIPPSMYIKQLKENPGSFTLPNKSDDLIKL